MGGHDVVLLHGQPGSAADWRQVADRLPETLRVAALDRQIAVRKTAQDRLAADDKHIRITGDR